MTMCDKRGDRGGNEGRGGRGERKGEEKEEERTSELFRHHIKKFNLQIDAFWAENAISCQRDDTKTRKRDTFERIN